MSRGVPHSLELRTQVVAAVLAGTTIAQAAQRFGLDKSVVSRWVAADPVATVATDQREHALAQIEGLLLDLVAEHATTLRAELQAAARPAWLEKQSAADLAQLVVAQRDTLIRLLAGFRPVVDEPEQSQLGPAPAPEAEQ
jgi:transposase-like protein